MSDPVHAPSSPSWSRLAQGVALALDLHATQTRKGTDTPYISHLLGVAGLVLEYGGDEDQAIAAMLHDAIEDQGVQHEPVIAERFGPVVARIVRGCTDADTLPKPPWNERKQSYINHLAHADADVLLVSAADKRDPRTGPGAVPDLAPARDIYIPDLRLGSGIKVPTRDFR